MVDVMVAAQDEDRVLPKTRTLAPGLVAAAVGTAIAFVVGVGTLRALVAWLLRLRI